jgi:hypothetical protein
MPLLNSLTIEAKLVQVTGSATKHAHKNFPSRLGGFFLYISLGVEGWLWTGWVVRLGGFDCFLLFVVVGGRNKIGSSLLTFVLTPLKANTQFVCGFGFTLLNSTQVILNHFLTHNSSLKMSSQICNLLLYLGVPFDSMKKLTLERTTHYTRRG